MVGSLYIYIHSRYIKRTSVKYLYGTGNISLCTAESESDVHYSSTLMCKIPNEFF
jgi:hypothetical protein